MTLTLSCHQRIVSIKVKQVQQMVKHHQNEQRDNPRIQGEAKEERHNCPNAKNLVKSKAKLLLITTSHSINMYPMIKRDEEITIVMKRVMPVEKDGTHSTDKDAMADTRNMLQSVQVLQLNIISVTLMQRPPESRLHHEMH